MRTRQKEKCVGYIGLVFFDDKSGETVTIGDAGFITPEEFEQAWADVPAFQGVSSFQADSMDDLGDIVDEKTVDVVACEKLMGNPITTLISEGRAKLAAELAEYRN